MQPTVPKQPRFLDQVRASSAGAATSLPVPRKPTSSGSAVLSSSTASAILLRWVRPRSWPFSITWPVRVRSRRALSLRHSMPCCFSINGVLETDPGWFDGLTRVQRKKSLPVVLSEGEVLRALSAMSGTPRLMAQLTGCGSSTSRSNAGAQGAFPECPLPRCLGLRATDCIWPASDLRS